MIRLSCSRLGDGAATARSVKTSSDDCFDVGEGAVVGDRHSLRAASESAKPVAAPMTTLSVS